MNAIHADLAAAGKSPSKKRICQLLTIPRSTSYYHPRKSGRVTRLDPDLCGRIKKLLDAFPTRGVRFVWAQLRFAQGLLLTRKKVYRIMKERGWTVRQRKAGSRPRVPGSASIAEKPNQRWATDFGLVHCGRDGWCVFAPVIDCCTREVLGWSLQTTGRTKTAELALEEALIHRFGWVRGAPPGMRLRHDNGLVFGSRAYRALVRDYGLTQEYIAPYTPEQNGLCERFIRTFKEECAWLHNFKDIAEARRVVAAFIQFYNAERRHQSLGYLTPQQYNQTRKDAA